MAETLGESTHVPSNKQRSTLFLAAMRHFAQELRDEKLPLVYYSLEEHGQPDFTSAINATLRHCAMTQVRVVLPGDYRVLQEIKRCCTDHNLPLEVLADNHFIAKPGEFSAWKKGKKQLRMEYWYRQLRKRTGILMSGDMPVGGDWNYDKDNRGTFGKAGPGLLDSALVFPVDKITQSAMDSSAALNLKLLSPMEVVLAAEHAYSRGHAPLNAVEGFIRQILGWREYVRGLYWSLMPEWKEMNALDAQQNLPDFYWHGEVDMACLSHSIRQVLDTGYGHHIQRLMVTGLFAQLWQTRPEQIHAWYLAMYVDAVEWVELPNVLGMSQYADGGIMASKPYIATGRYIAKMSNYCDHCRYKPDEAETENACPFTTLYWEFLQKHRARFQQHPRLALQVKHLDNQSDDKRAAIARRAQWVRAHYPANHYI